MQQLEIFDLVEKKAPANSATMLLEHELALWKCGFCQIAGVDEVGRGPLAGPVVACACILPKGVVFHGIKDSKALSINERKRFSLFLTTHPDIHYAISEVSHTKIDEVNILRATLLAMKEAVELLCKKPDFVLVDGRDKPYIDPPCRAVVRGDAVSQSIAAASIIAKVHRDALMDTFHERYPHYGFNKHKGYATAQHLKAIEKYGATPIHRKSFGIIKQQTLLEAPTLF